MSDISYKDMLENYAKSLPKKVKPTEDAVRSAAFIVNDLNRKWEAKLKDAVEAERQACEDLAKMHCNTDDPYKPVSAFQSGSYSTAEAIVESIASRKKAGKS